MQNTKKHKIRYDLEIIAQLIKKDSKVLDIGCGDGELLKFLKNNKNVNARGLELSQEKVSEALSKGLSVIQGDCENDLDFYPDQSFDYAILSQTIQATKRPDLVLEEMLRIAKYVIVSLPNFAYYKNRLQFLLKGVMPVSKELPFEWYETPNIHFCSIKDFEKLCKKLNLTIEKKVFLTSKHKLSSLGKFDSIANIFAEYGVFLIKKNEFCPTMQEEFTTNRSFSRKIGLNQTSPVNAFK